MLIKGACWSKKNRFHTFICTYYRGHFCDLFTLKCNLLTILSNDAFIFKNIFHFIHMKCNYFKHKRSFVSMKQLTIKVVHHSFLHARKVSSRYFTDFFFCSDSHISFECALRLAPLENTPCLCSYPELQVAAKSWWTWEARFPSKAR